MFRFKSRSVDGGRPLVDEALLVEVGDAGTGEPVDGVPLLSAATLLLRLSSCLFATMGALISGVGVLCRSIWPLSFSSDVRGVELREEPAPVPPFWCWWVVK